MDGATQKSVGYTPKVTHLRVPAGRSDSPDIEEHFARLAKMWEQNEPKQSKENQKPMSEVSRYELDAKLEAIESRMDARVQRIETLANSIGEQSQRIEDSAAETRQLVKSSMWNAWFAMLAGVAIVVAVVALLMDTINSASSDNSAWTRDAISEIRAERREASDRAKEVESAILQLNEAMRQLQQQQVKTSPADNPEKAN